MSTSYLLPAGNLRNRILILLMIAVVAVLAAFPVLAAASPEQTMAWGTMGMKLFGGLAIALFDRR